jgi:hypothetical protein
LLHRCLGTAEDRASENQGGPSDVSEFPRHVSPHIPAESALEVSGYAILPHRLSSVAIGVLLEGKEEEGKER